MSQDQGPKPAVPADIAQQSIEMLKAVVEGQTYDAVAGRFGVTRTAVERRIKVVAMQLARDEGVAGLHPDAAAFVQRLRKHRASIVAALVAFEPTVRARRQPGRVISSEELDRAAQRIRGRSQQPARDQALFYTLFATGARPLEIARLEVRDYLNADGSVRLTSEMRAEVSIAGKARPLYFTSPRIAALLDAYMAERVAQRLGMGIAAAFRGLDPCSLLFLTPDGEGFRITPCGEDGQRRHLCRAILETYRKLFRYAELRDVTTLSVRRTLASRLYERGADEDQVGQILGISARSAVREHFPRPRPAFPDLMRGVV